MNFGIMEATRSLTEVLTPRLGSWAPWASLAISAFSILGPHRVMTSNLVFGAMANNAPNVLAAGRVLMQADAGLIVQQGLMTQIRAARQLVGLEAALRQIANRDIFQEIRDRLVTLGTNQNQIVTDAMLRGAINEVVGTLPETMRPLFLEAGVRSWNQILTSARAELGAAAGFTRHYGRLAEILQASHIARSAEFLVAANEAAINELINGMRGVNVTLSETAANDLAQALRAANGNAAAIDAALVGAGATTVTAEMRAAAGAWSAVYAPNRSALIAYADSFRQLVSANRPGAVAELETSFGTFFGRSNFRGPRHPVLDEILDALPIAERSRFHGGCADIHAIDLALRAVEASTGVSITSIAQAREALAGTLMQTARVRPISSPQAALHGTSILPCDSCQPVIEALGIIFR